MKRFIYDMIRNCNLLLCHLLFYPYMVIHHVSRNRFDKLHVGCGKNRFNGWINADISAKSDLIVFLQKKLPFRKNTLRRIYAEHVLEHVSYETAVFFLKESYRTLHYDGIIRIAMPDLDDLIDGYQTDWKRFDWVKFPEFSFIKTRAEMINIAFRWWGHQHLYNREELARALTDAGFSNFRYEEYGQSDHHDLRNLETRLDSRLIIEARKT